LLSSSTPDHRRRVPGASEFNPRQITPPTTPKRPLHSIPLHDTQLRPLFHIPHAELHPLRPRCRHPSRHYTVPVSVLRRGTVFSDNHIHEYTLCRSRTVEANDLRPQAGCSFHQLSTTLASANVTRNTANPHRSSNHSTREEQQRCASEKGNRRTGSRREEGLPGAAQEPTSGEVAFCIYFTPRPPNPALSDSLTGPSRKDFPRIRSLCVFFPSCGDKADPRSPVHRSPLVPVTIPRTDALPLSQNHPHARKKSVVSDPAFAQDFPPSPAYSSSATPASSTTSFSLGLDPIAEASLNVLSSYPTTPILAQPSIEPATPSIFPIPSGHPVYGYVPSSASSSVSSLSRPQRHSNLGIGYPSSSGNLNSRPPRSAFSVSFPHVPNNSELILYSYAQLAGFVNVVPVPGVKITPEQAHNFKRLRDTLTKKNVVGGGSMDINPSLLSRTSSSGRQSPLVGPDSAASSRSSMDHGRTNSLTGSLLSMLSPSNLLGSAASSPVPSTSPSSPAVQGRWTSSSSSLASEGSERDVPGHPSDPPDANKGVGLGLEMEMRRDSSSSVLSSGSPYPSTPNLHSAGMLTHVRSRSTSTSSLTGRRTPGPTHSRRSSIAWLLGVGGDPSGSASGSLDAQSHTNSEASLPTFEVQPAMLAVDLMLQPGESKSCEFVPVHPFD